MALFRMFLREDGTEIEELRPEILMGETDNADVEKSLLQSLITACADACELQKPKLGEVRFLTERFTDLNIPIHIAVQRINARSKELSGVHEARGNCPIILNGVLAP